MLLSTGQVAERLGVSRNTVSLWIRQGRLRAILVGGKYVVDTSNLEDFERPQMGRPRKV